MSLFLSICWFGTLAASFYLALRLLKKFGLY